MPNKQYQANLFDGQVTEKIMLPDADIFYWPDFFDHRSAWQWYEGLVDQTNWRLETITIYGKRHKIPRLSCWMADEGLDYSYSNMTMQPELWSKQILVIKLELERKLKLSFNSVLINYYRDGQDSNGWHADDEIELGVNPIIASMSLGGSRDFHLKHKTNKQLKYSITLEHGSLLLMQGTTQAYWQHQVPKRVNAEPRINLTFRTIYKNS